ncbi:MAG: GNAT family N-acetyltransferase [Oscillospiraceae bacterium]|nr:GNAT family N-acetyltransferase [Oscillospiraceae bacterium]
MASCTEYEIFSACFPMLNPGEKLFKELSEFEDCERLNTEGGFALIKENAITLFAVHPDYRKRGVGSALLKVCESAISDNGFKRAELGGFLYGAVGDSCSFFEKRGYTLGNEYCEMKISLSDYRDTLPEADAAFRFCDDMDEIRSAVGKVDDDWVQFFDGSGKYFCGFDSSGKLISFCDVDDDVNCLISEDGIRTGSVGCVGTIPEARGKGAGLKMVSLALEELKNRGCGQCFIHQTHLDGWYGKLGAQTVLRFRSAEKKL